MPDSQGSQQLPWPTFQARGVPPAFPKRCEGRRGAYILAADLRGRSIGLSVGLTRFRPALPAASAAPLVRSASGPCPPERWSGPSRGPSRPAEDPGRFGAPRATLMRCLAASVGPNVLRCAECDALSASAPRAPRAPAAASGLRAGGSAPAASIGLPVEATLCAGAPSSWESALPSWGGLAGAGVAREAVASRSAPVAEADARLAPAPAPVALDLAPPMDFRARWLLAELPAPQQASLAGPPFSGALAHPHLTADDAQQATTGPKRRHDMHTRTSAKRISSPMTSVPTERSAEASIALWGGTKASMRASTTARTAATSVITTVGTPAAAGRHESRSARRRTCFPSRTPACAPGRSERPTSTPAVASWSSSSRGCHARPASDGWLSRPVASTARTPLPWYANAPRERSARAAGPTPQQPRQRWNGRSEHAV
mmetsp:Transcript_18713/g.71174  ORF Transcript_18713/g.71174 Transcript_18713/m.71174 type:complete len:430 (+) Transcript_18713:1501-2790(+)